MFNNIVIFSEVINSILRLILSDIWKLLLMPIFHCPHCDSFIGVHKKRKGHLSQIIGGHLTSCRRNIPKVTMNATVVEQSFPSLPIPEPILYEVEESEPTAIERNVKSTFHFNKIYLAFQIAVEEAYLESINSSGGRVLCADETFARSEWKDYLDLMVFKVDVGLSNREGDDLLKLIRAMTARRGWQLPLPKRMKTVVRAVEATRRSDYGLRDVEIPFDSDFLNKENAPSLKNCTGSLVNPLFLLSEWFLTLEEDDVFLHPHNPVSCNGVPMISNYASGAVFGKLYKRLQEDYGEDVYPIVLDVNFDSMDVDLIGKNKLKPLKMRVKNVADHLVECEENVFTIGYGAVFHHTKNEMLQFLDASGIGAKGKRMEALKYLNR